MFANFEFKNVVWIIVTAAVIAAIIILFRFLKKRQDKKQDEYQETIDANRQTVNMLIIDKKKLRLKQSGLPEAVINETKWYAKIFKVPVVKAKVGPQIMVFIADNTIFDTIPVKKEVKAVVSGLYIVSVRGIRGQLEKPVKKKRLRFLSKLFGEK